MKIMMMLKMMYQFGSFWGYSEGIARYPIFPDHGDALP